MPKSVIEKFIDGMSWVDPISDKIQPAITNLFRQTGEVGRTAEDFLHGVWLGHPLHPMITDVPVGAWTMTEMFDLFSLISDHSEDLDTAADITMAAGVLGAVAAAASGIADWSQVHGEQRRAGSVHAILNTAGLTLNVASLAIRVAGGHRGLARTLSLGGYGISALSAYIGGDLVYKLGMGVNRDAWVAKPKEFTDAIAESELEIGKPVRVEVAGTKVAVLKDNDNIHAFAAVCPHIGGPLDEGDIENHIVTCPWHQSQFDIRTGDLIHGPATTSLPCFEVRRQNGMVQVRLEQDIEERGGPAGN